MDRSGGVTASIRHNSPEREANPELTFSSSVAVALHDDRSRASASSRLKWRRTAEVCRAAGRDRGDADPPDGRSGVERGGAAANRYATAGGFADSISCWRCGDQGVIFVLGDAARMKSAFAVALGASVGACCGCRWHGMAWATVGSRSGSAEVRGRARTVEYLFQVEPVDAQTSSWLRSCSAGGRWLMYRRGGRRESIR